MRDYNMSDYIKREDALNALDELCERICPYSKLQRGAMCVACTLGSAFYVIEDEIPSADVVEVVRCKDCKYWNASMTPADRDEAAKNPATDGVCGLYDGDGFHPHDYCSNAIRRTDDGENADAPQ